MWAITQDWLRRLVLVTWYRFLAPADLRLRADVLEVGVFSGKVSALDRAFAEERNLKPLSKFEKWLFVPYIKVQKDVRWQNWRQVCIRHLGEDPEDDWGEI